MGQYRARVEEQSDCQGYPGAAQWRAEDRRGINQTRPDPKEGKADGESYRRTKRHVIRNDHSIAPNRMLGQH